MLWRYTEAVNEKLGPEVLERETVADERQFLVHSPVIYIFLVCCIAVAVVHIIPILFPCKQLP